MRFRDLILVLGVVLLAGFAAADALRSRGETRSRATTEARGETAAEAEPNAPELQETPPGYPVGVLRGTLVLTDAEDCRVREVSLAGGSERPLPRLAGDCRLWAAPRGARLAYGLGGGAGDRVPFKFVDLSSPGRNLGGYSALFGFVTWSADGHRAAWCGRKRVGFDLELGRGARRLPECPAAYTADGRIAYARGNRLVIEGDGVIRAPDAITYVARALDGSLALVIQGERVQVHQPSGNVMDVPLPRRLEGRLPILAPDGCAALFTRPAEDLVELLPFGCFRGESNTYFGRAAAWSPDGEWIALAESDAITFRRVVGGSGVIRYPLAAAELYWRD